MIPNPEEHSLIGLIRPIFAREYAIGRGWEKVTTSSSDYTVFSHPDVDLAQLSIPKKPEIPDYAQRIRDVANRLSETEKRPVISILRDMIRPNSDCLHFRQVSDISRSGRIPLRDGILLLSGIRKTLESSACGVVDPQRYFKRLHRTEAKQFLDACMLEQTEFGSFVMNVSCPLSPLEAEDKRAKFFPDTPLVRQIVQYAIRAADSIVRSIECDEINKLINETGELSRKKSQDNVILNANFCDAILEVYSSHGEGELHLSASWAPKIPLTIEMPGNVRFVPEYFEKVEEISRQLRPSEEAEETLTVFAKVEELAGELSESGHREGNVKLLVLDQDNDELVPATASLSADDYITADRAHMSGGYVRVTGTFRKGPRKHFLTGIQTFELLDDSGAHLE